MVYTENAVFCFYDYNALIISDINHSKNEDRLNIIGYSDRGLLFVVFVERHTNSIRIISARFANKKERLFYELKK